MRRSFAGLGLLLACALSAFGAINPEEYKKIASDPLRLRELARVIETDKPANPSRRRITIVAEVIEVLRPATSRVRPRDVIVIDYSIDLAARADAQKAFAAKGAMPGPQFLHEPEPPELDETKEFIAYLARAGTRLANVNRYAGSVVDFETEHFSGAVFVPVAAQYSFELPR